MKRPLFVLLILTLCCIAGWCQTPYYDAVKIFKILDANDSLPVPTVNCSAPAHASNELCLRFREWTDIMRPYVPADKRRRPIDVATYLKANNPFFAKIIGTLPTAVAGGSDFTTLVQPFSLSALGGIDVTNFADGMARFMIKRMKEELNIIFFEQFNKKLKEQKDLQLLFPSTYSILMTASGEIYHYQRYLPALREAFEFDLDEFFTNGYSWSTAAADRSPLLRSLHSNDTIKNSVRLIFYTGRELDMGRHPGDVINGILHEDSIDLNAIDKNLKSYFAIANMFSQSLRSVSLDRYWITPEEGGVLVSDTRIINIFFGIVYEKSPISLTLKNKRFRDVLAPLAERLATAQALIRSYTQLVTAVDNIRQTIQGNPGKDGSDYFTLAKQTIQLVNFFISDSLTANAFPQGTLTEIRFYTEHAALLLADMESRAYNALVYEAYAILDRALRHNDKRENVLEPFLKYGTFMASVATAENSEEVSYAIEAVALPAGSARIKRESAWNFSLNTYLGGFYGEENIPKQNGSGHTSNSFGVFAPVGVAISRSFRTWEANWSLSLFGSLVDIGALAAYRIKDDQLETVPQVKLEHIVSPGAYLILGLPKIPISLGFGGQIGPRLREVKSDQNDIFQDKYERWAGFIAVDIPLANFYSKARKK